jgi:hypothetical protein
MPHLRVSLAFAEASDNSLLNTANAVSTNLYGNAAYPTPPVTKVALDAEITAFTAAIAAMEQGGTSATAAKNTVREALIAMLRLLASYVQDNCNNDLGTLLSSGFQAASTNHAPTPSLVSVPVINRITNGTTGQLILRITAIPNSHGYNVRYATIGTGGAQGPWVDGGHFTDSRAMIVNGLTAGTMYAFQVCAHLGGSRTTGWSDAVQHMSM